MKNKAIDALYHWLERATPGAVHVYYRGFLLYDRDDESNGERQRTIGLAKEAMMLANQGDIALTQRRVGFMYYEYLATCLR